MSSLSMLDLFYIGLFNVQCADVHYANIKPTNAQSADVQSSNVQSIDVQSGCPDYSLKFFANYCKFSQIFADLQYHFLCGSKLDCPRSRDREK